MSVARPWLALALLVPSIALADDPAPADGQKSGDDAAKSADGQKSGDDATKPADGQKPGDAATKPGDDASKPGDDASKPGDDASKPAGDGADVPDSPYAKPWDPSQDAPPDPKTLPPPKPTAPAIAPTSPPTPKAVPSITHAALKPEGPNGAGIEPSFRLLFGSNGGGIAPAPAYRVVANVQDAHNYVVQVGYGFSHHGLTDAGRLYGDTASGLAIDGSADFHTAYAGAKVFPLAEKLGTGGRVVPYVSSGVGLVVAVARVTETGTGLVGTPSPSVHAEVEVAGGADLRLSKAFSIAPQARITSLPAIRISHDHARFESLFLFDPGLSAMVHW